MAETDEPPKLSGFSSIVPHFHYDLIGRIVPGAYLLAGAYWLLVGRGCLAKPGAMPSATALFLLALTAYAVGYMLGPVSHLLFDCWCRFKEDDISKSANTILGQGHLKDFAVANKDVVLKSEFCFYVLWLRAPQLAIMRSRWDAEAFAARQFGTATLILVLIFVVMAVCHTSPAQGVLFFCVTVPTFVLCIRQFQYIRRKAILSRFIMLACVPYDRTKAEAN